LIWLSIFAPSGSGFRKLSNSPTNLLWKFKSLKVIPKASPFTTPAPALLNSSKSLDSEAGIGYSLSLVELARNSLVSRGFSPFTFLKTK